MKIRVNFHRKILKRKPIFVDFYFIYFFKITFIHSDFVFDEYNKILVFKLIIAYNYDKIIIIIINKKNRIIISNSQNGKFA